MVFSTLPIRLPFDKSTLVYQEMHCIVTLRLRASQKVPGDFSKRWPMSCASSYPMSHSVTKPQLSRSGTGIHIFISLGTCLILAWRSCTTYRSAAPWQTKIPPLTCHPLKSAVVLSSLVQVGLHTDGGNNKHRFIVMTPFGEYKGGHLVIETCSGLLDP